MDVSESIDREVIVERAETVRDWLAGLSLSSRALGALQRELNGIIANDPGGYINGHRPLAGLTVNDVIAEVHSRNGGAVGRVKSVGDSVLAELRAAIQPEGALSAEPEASAAAAAPEAQAEPTPAAADATPEEPEPAAAVPPAELGEPAPASADATPEDEPGAAPAAVVAAPLEQAAPEGAPRRRGRPKGSKSTRPRAAPPATQAPRPEPAAPLAVAPEPVPAVAGDDPVLSQLTQLWPALHPQARRAIVLYAGTLLIEGAYQP